MQPYALRTLLRTTACGLLATVALCFGAGAGAQSPGGQAKILVGFAPGGNYDLIARLLADRLGVELARPVIVENRPGAAGRLVVDVLKASPSDGSVVMVGQDGLLSLYPLTYRRLNYDPKTDLTPIGFVAENPFALVVAPNVKSFQEFITIAQQNAERASFGHGARGSPHHFLGLKLGEKIKVKLADVPFQGSTPMLTSLMGGHLTAGMDPLSGTLLELHRGGKVRILAVSSPKRVPQLPDVPTFQELGYPDMVTVSGTVLYAPAKTPPETVQRLNQALNNALRDPHVQRELEIMGGRVIPGNPEAVAARAAADLKVWVPVVRASGFIAD